VAKVVSLEHVLTNRDVSLTRQPHPCGAPGSGGETASLVARLTLSNTALACLSSSRHPRPINGYPLLRPDAHQSQGFLLAYHPEEAFRITSVVAGSCWNLHDMEAG
jgi:hypothetical protein